MGFLALAYPSISEADFNWLQAYRAENDELFYGKLAPHFTIVFPLTNMTQEQFITEIAKQLSGVKKIDFELNAASTHKDEFSEYYFQFLIPGKGYDDIVKFHDKLYSGNLLLNWRRDIEYIPHITIGNSRDETKCRSETDRLNELNLSISGQIQNLTVAKYEDGIVTNLETFDLK